MTTYRYLMTLYTSKGTTAVPLDVRADQNLWALAKTKMAELAEPLHPQRVTIDCVGKLEGRKLKQVPERVPPGDGRAPQGAAMTPEDIYDIEEPFDVR